MGATAKAASLCNGDVRFELAVQRDTLPADGWPQFVYRGKKLKLRAPAPAVLLKGAEWKQWRWDFTTFKFDKLRDRKLLYAYELSNEKNAEAVLNAIKEEVQAGEDGGGVPRTVIGVKYDTTGMKLWDKPDLYKMAIVPVKWNEEFHEFIKSKNDPATFAELVGATVTALLTGTYENLKAIEGWSTLAQYESGVVDTGKSSLPPEAVAAYWKMVSKGPCIWLNLKPVASFVAVDRKLDIQGMEAEPILTSKSVWSWWWETEE